HKPKGLVTTHRDPEGRPSADPTPVRDVSASPSVSRQPGGRPDDRAAAADRPPAPVIHGDPRRR
ncbi:MAG: hypothetical protein L0H64_24070, partial [Pseudonocardia sp.]|nr:hypothetical protein [Pseudonocardia sp.]